METNFNTVWYSKADPGCTVRVLISDSAGILFEETGSGARERVPLAKFLMRYSKAVKASAIDSPQHYQVFPDKEAIEIIASSMTTEQFYGYCLGNFLKYRLRIGAKDEVQQELGKSNKYKELYEKHKHMCK